MKMCIYFFFFFKQKTAYEMRISDWSSDVCSSDLGYDQQVTVISELKKKAEKKSGPSKSKQKAEQDLFLLKQTFEQSDLDSRNKLQDEIGRASCRERVCQYV